MKYLTDRARNLLFMKTVNSGSYTVYVLLEKSSRSHSNPAKFSILNATGLIIPTPLGLRDLPHLLLLFLLYYLHNLYIFQ